MSESTARRIRATLEKYFPVTPFQVVAGDNAYASPADVIVKWNNGPSKLAVGAMASHIAYGAGAYLSLDRGYTADVKADALREIGEHGRAYSSLRVRDHLIIQRIARMLAVRDLSDDHAIARYRAIAERGDSDARAVTILGVDDLKAQARYRILWSRAGDGCARDVASAPTISAGVALARLIVATGAGPGALISIPPAVAMDYALSVRALIEHWIDAKADVNAGARYDIDHCPLFHVTGAL